MNKLTSVVVAAGAVVAMNVATAVPAHAAVPSCTLAVVAAQVTPHPLDVQYDLIDVATATGACVDLSLASHTASINLEWYYSGGAMPACPSTLGPIAVSTPAAPVVAAETVGFCQRPPSSPAWETYRYVCADLIVDNMLLQSACSDVLLNPTPIL